MEQLVVENVNGNLVFIIIGFLTMIAQNYFKARNDHDVWVQTREDRRLEIEEARSQREAKALEIKFELEKARVAAEDHATRLAADVISATDLATAASKEAAKEANNVNLKIERMGELIHETQSNKEGKK